MKYPHISFTDAKTEKIDEPSFITICAFYDVNANGSVIDDEESATALLLKRGAETRTFNKREVEFLKDFYGHVEFEEVPDDELFEWKRFTFNELLQKCRNDFVFARLVELEFKLGRFYVYDSHHPDDEWVIIVHLF